MSNSVKVRLDVDGEWVVIDALDSDYDHHRLVISTDAARELLAKLPDVLDPKKPTPERSEETLKAEIKAEERELELEILAEQARLIRCGEEPRYAYHQASGRVRFRRWWNSIQPALCGIILALAVLGGLTAYGLMCWVQASW